jgi:hypothetical protein
MAEQMAVIERDSAGKFTKLPPQATAKMITTSEQGRELNRRRQEKYRAAAERGAIAALNDSGAVPRELKGNTGEDAWVAIIRARALLALDPEAQRSGNDAARLVGQAMAALHDDKQSGGNAALTITFDAQTAGALLELLASRSQDAQSDTYYNEESASGGSLGSDG